MKLIAKTTYGWIIEANTEELKDLAKYSSNKNLEIGMNININPTLARLDYVKNISTGENYSSLLKNAKELMKGLEVFDKNLVKIKEDVKSIDTTKI